MTQRLTWPTNRFYWATLDAPGVRRVGPIPTGLLPLLEDDVPANADDLHAVGVPLSGGRLGVCAAEAAALRAVPPGVLSLTPEALPSLPRQPGSQPRSVQPARGGVRTAAAASPSFPSPRVRRGNSGALRGVARGRPAPARTAHWESYTHDARTASQTIAAEAASVPPHQLAAQASRVRGTLDALAKAAPSPDASIALAAVLRAWPTSIPSKPQSITTNAAGIAISVTLEGEPAAFLDAFTPPQGWMLDEPRVNTVDKVSRLALQLRPKGARP
ncbi:MAG: hypothetical protein IPM33_10600 [Phycisphaerales bacterium]|nr:hypothetical protein [Phycisphaerales bacterium]